MLGEAGAPTPRRSKQQEHADGDSEEPERLVARAAGVLDMISEEGGKTQASKVELARVGIKQGD